MTPDIIAKFLTGAKQSREAKKIKPVWQQYMTSPFAKQQLGLARQLYGGRMFGAPQLERNIFSNQANFIGNVLRNARDSSQALALGAASQGQTNEALTDLQTREAQNRYSMLENLNRAYGVMTGEREKEYQSLHEKYLQDVQRKDALAQAGATNKYGALSDWTSLGLRFASLMMGNPAGAFGGNQTPTLAQPNTTPVSVIPYNIPNISGNIIPRR